MNTALFPVFLNRFSAVRDSVFVNQSTVVVVLPCNGHLISSCQLELRVCAITSLKHWGNRLEVYGLLAGHRIQLVLIGEVRWPALISDLM